MACLAGSIVGARNNVLAVEPLKASSKATRMERGLHENHGFLNSPHTSVREKWIGREKYTRQSNVNNLSHISQGTLCFAYDKLFVKIMAASIEGSIVIALDHLNMSREKQKIIQVQWSVYHTNFLHSTLQRSVEREVRSFPG